MIWLCGYLSPITNKNSDFTTWKNDCGDYYFQNYGRNPDDHEHWTYYVNKETHGDIRYYHLETWKKVYYGKVIVRWKKFGCQPYRCNNAAEPRDKKKHPGYA